jgi:hypothetical protein
MRFLRLASVVFGGVAVIGLGCGEDAELANHPPNVLSLFVVPENPAPGDTVQIRYNVDDVDGDPVQLQWETTGGTISPTGLWQVPDVEGTYRITLFASDGRSSDRKTLDVRVWQPRPGNYYPLAVGNQWVFEDERQNTIHFRIIDTIRIEHTNITSYVLEVETSDPAVEKGVTNYAYVGRAKDGIEQHAVNVIFGSPETLIFDPWLPLYRFPLMPGKTWAAKFKGKLPDGFFIGEGTARYRVVDESTLTTPAGTFEHVFQVEEVFRWTLIGQTLDETVSRKWLAPDVGIVRLDQEQTRGGQTQRTRAQLVSYSLLPDTSFDTIPASPPLLRLPTARLR